MDKEKKEKIMLKVEQILQRRSNRPTELLQWRQYESLAIPEEKRDGRVKYIEVQIVNFKDVLVPQKVWYEVILEWEENNWRHRKTLLSSESLSETLVAFENL